MYSYEAIVRYSETHGRFHTDIAAIANYFQDCAIMESEAVGRGIDYLAEHKRAWFLASWQIEVDRYPRLCEKIQVRTWAYDFKSSTGYRNIDIIDESGLRIVKAATVWSYVDTESGRPTRMDEEVSDVYQLGPRIDMEYAPRKIKLWDGYETVDTVKVMTYQIDSNNHMNNEAYIALALEYAYKAADIRSVRAEYRRPFVKDDIIVVKHAIRNEYEHVLMCDEDDNIGCVVEFCTEGAGTINNA